jgi:hypothetical protein
MVPHFESRLFIAATPDSGYDESFSALLELLDDQRFARAVVPTKAQLRPAMIRRLNRLPSSPKLARIARGAADLRRRVQPRPDQAPSDAACTLRVLRTVT